MFPFGWAFRPKMNGINPQAYLTDIPGRIADHPIHKIDALLPWFWTQ